MIGYVTKILDNVKMSVAQWLIIMVTAVVGGLVLALKVQGSRLHRAQIELLSHQLADVQDKAQAKTDAARKVYGIQLDAFFKAGGKL